MNSSSQSTITVNLRDDVWPPGFRFHPTDEELVVYYLKRKICRRKLKLDIIAEVDVYKFEPEDLPELSSLKNGDRQWFFFSPRDRKYPNCSRANRATRQGYWKTTGKDRTITCNSRDVGIKKTLVFYRGRAPTGQRTDWVMHEYTLEEDELKRCQNVHDYYAIYKMFKKSGPGPKNGEQYGAPFREEDWADDNFLKNSGNCNPVNADQQEGNVSHAETCRGAQVDVSETGIDEILNNTVEVDHHSLWRANLDDLEHAISQFIGEDETRSMANASVGEAVYVKPCMTHTLGSHQNKNANYAFGQSWNATGVTSAMNCGFMPELTSPTFLESAYQELSVNGFLEMNDLVGPEPVQGPSIQVQQTIGTYGNAQLRDDGSDLYHDTDLFLGDLTSNNQTVAPTQYPWLQEDGFSNQVEPYPDSVSTFRNATMNPDIHSYVHNPTEAPRRFMALQPPGALCANVSENLTAETNKRGNETHTEEAQPWFSSTLWSFVESIPAAPASAAETVLANKTFKRMSNFGQVRITSKRTVICTSGAVKSKGAGVGGKTKGFFLISFLAALFAVVCVFFASSIGNLHCSIDL